MPRSPMMGGRARRTDANQQAIVKGLRDFGCSVKTLSSVGGGCPDLLVGLYGRNFLFEVKDPDKVPSARRLTEHEQQWHAAWRGQVDVIKSAQEAADIIRNHLAGRTAG